MSEDLEQEIAAARAEIVRLREALRRIAEYDVDLLTEDKAPEMSRIAEKALEE